MIGHTHSELIEIGRQWLLRPWNKPWPKPGSEASRGACGVVLTDMTSSSSETPDAIGWHNRGSVLIECKVTRSDFKADQRKHLGGILKRVLEHRDIT